MKQRTEKKNERDNLLSRRNVQRIALYFSPLIIIAIIWLIAKGGKEDKGQVGEGTVVDEKTQTSPPASQKTDEVSVGILSVRIIPDVPTVREDIQALIGQGVQGAISYRWAVNEKNVDGSGSTLSRKQFTKGDKVSVMITADGTEAVAEAVIKNSPPEVTSVPFSPSAIHRGVDITVLPKGFDADNDEVKFRYQWLINGSEVEETGNVLRGDRFKRGDEVSVKVIPFDLEDDGDMYVSRPLIIPNAPPTFVSTPSQEFKGNMYTYNAVAQDPDGDALIYSLTAGPKGMTIDNATGRIVWEITQAGEGVHTVEVTAQDSEQLSGFQKYTLTITIPKGVEK